MATLTSSNMLLSFGVLVMLMTVTSANWRDLFEEESDPAYAWSPSLRSGYCARTNQACSRTVGCCSQSDICITKVNEAEMLGASTCRNIRPETRAFESLKYKDVPCYDSRECKDLCCREYRGHRYGKIRLCGTPEDELQRYTCIVRES